MSLEIETPTPFASFDGFDALKAAYDSHAPTQADLLAYGKYRAIDAVLLQTPLDVLARGEILTNPSQIETDRLLLGSELASVAFAYFRQEPTTLHLGKTSSVPYLLLRNRQGRRYLSEFTDAMMLEGEDPRVMRGVKIPGPHGTVHTGWCVSTVIATPKPNDPADVESIKQVFYWGKNLATLEPILEIPDLKNTCLYPLADINGDETDTSVDVFGRPHPHITYNRAKSVLAITKDSVLEGRNFTEGFLPPGIHTGVNTVKAAPGRPELRELDIHEACAPLTPDGKILHYRLGRYGVNLATGELTALGVIASRADFPSADPKPPENAVYSFYDVLYGSMGNAALGMMVTGVSDRHIGLARIVPAA